MAASQEHNENIDRGAYTWTSTDKEASILTAAGIVNGHTDYRRLSSLVAGRPHGIRRPVEVVGEPGRTVDRHPAHAEEPLSILITTQEFIISEPSAVLSVNGRALVPGPMWSEAGAGQRPVGIPITVKLGRHQTGA
ncbi:unnamed protein product [Echinostoma caproni]|uniref:Cupin domain-containing protein n=1 Tax=Echinostoma caproni TaxID=27848 RepID=A0A183A5W5_9TREM|nr:unnamed protein product [Echinostoma caproni]